MPKIAQTGFFGTFPNLWEENRMQSFRELWQAMDTIHLKEKDPLWLKEYLDMQEESFVQKGAFSQGEAGIFGPGRAGAGRQAEKWKNIGNDQIKVELLWQ